MVLSLRILSLLRTSSLTLASHRPAQVRLVPPSLSRRGASPEENITLTCYAHSLPIFSQHERQETEGRGRWKRLRHPYVAVAVRLTLDAQRQPAYTVPAK